MALNRKLQHESIPEVGFFSQVFACQISSVLLMDTILTGLETVVFSIHIYYYIICISYLLGLLFIQNSKCCPLP
jgi:hypothetical protein